MAAGDATAADCGPKYDVVINGKGYMLLDTLEESIPFRTHRAIYGQTQPFVERSNVSNSYGDNAQDFFLTIRQRDWSLGEQQKFFRAGQDGRYWAGSGVDVSVPGQVRLAPAFSALTFAGAVRAVSRVNLPQMAALSATNLYTVDAARSITDKGVHGLGASPAKFGFAFDGVNNFLSTTTAGTVGVRKWTGAAFSTYSATASDSLAFLNNTLYGYAAGVLQRYDSAGTATTLFTWKEAEGTTYSLTGDQAPILEPFGGKLLILFPYAQTGAELWIYDGTGVSLLAIFPSNYMASDLEVLYGVAYIAGSFQKAASASTQFNRPAIHFFDGSQIGLLWQANDFSTSASSDAFGGPHPALAAAQAKLLFTDDTMATILAYNPATGGVSTVGSYTAGGTDIRLGASNFVTLHTRNVVGGYGIGTSAYSASGYVISSLVDFDSSLPKQFRGIKIEWDPATDGNGGTVDIAYQVDSLTGSWTTLQSGAVSGTEYTLSGVSGHAIAVRITINVGTSTAGPTLKSFSVRGAPEMPVYPRGEYIIDCTNTSADARILRDDSFHALTGYEQVVNLVAARNATAPFSITDKINGTFTGFVDVNDAEGFDVYEIHPDPDDKARPGSYVVRLTVRGV